MFSIGLAHHSPLIQDYPGAPPAAPPAPAPTPIPPPAVPLAFSVVTRASVYGIVGTPLGSTTLATVTCTDTSATIIQSVDVPGLTFSYTSNVLTVAGTPTGNAAVYRVVVSYIASSDGATVLGSSEHEVTIANAAQVLTVGAMAGVSGRVGEYLSVVLCSPTANFDVDLLSYASSVIPGLSLALVWNKAGRTGTLTLSGTPTETYGPSYFSTRFIGNGQDLGGGSSTCVIAAAYQPIPPAPAPAPAPSPPAPSPPPVPAPAPAPGRVPDPYLSSTKVLMHFDDNPGLSVDQDLTFDERGNTFTNYGATQGMGAVGGSAILAGASKITGAVSGIDGSNGLLTVECMVDIGDVLWSALTADGIDDRYSAAITLLSEAGDVVWTIGFLSFYDNYSSKTPRRYVVPNFRSGLSSTEPFGYGKRINSFGAAITSKPGRFVSLISCRRQYTGGKFLQGTFFDGKSFGNSAGFYNVSELETAASGALQIGGRCEPIEYGLYQRNTTILPFYGGVDDVRVTAASRYESVIAAFDSVGEIKPAARVIPWPNY